MNEKNKRKSNGTGFVIKVVVPVTLLLIVVGFLYWGSQAVKDPNRSKHKMADGVAKFYSTFRKPFMDEATKLDEYTIKLPEDGDSVFDQLQYRSMQVKPADKNWTGENKKRSFEENGTIKTALESFGNAEGVQVIWDLKYDYIIKNHFVEQVNFKELIDKISRTVNNDYDGHVKSYFCAMERAIVITDQADRYVTNNCDLTTSKRRLQLDKRRAEDYKMRQKLNSN